MMNRLKKAVISGVLAIVSSGLILPATVAGEALAIDLVVQEEAGPFAAATFSLDLAKLDLERAGTFRLFPDAGILVRPTATVELEPGFGMSLVYAMDDDRIPEGLQMSFKERTWKDYDGWEKAGYILSEASAAVGAAYLLYRLID